MPWKTPTQPNAPPTSQRGAGGILVVAGIVGALTGVLSSIGVLMWISVATGAPVLSEVRKQGDVDTALLYSIEIVERLQKGRVIDDLVLQASSGQRAALEAHGLLDQVFLDDPKLSPLEKEKAFALSYLLTRFEAEKARADGNDDLATRLERQSTIQGEYALTRYGQGDKQRVLVHFLSILRCTSSAFKEPGCRS